MSNTVKDEISFNYISLTTEEMNTVQVVQPFTNVIEVLTGPMGPPGPPGPNFIDKEIPSGSINGLNDTFTLQYLPVLGSEHIFLNGILQDQPDDYTINSSSITFDFAPESQSSIKCSYRTM